MMYTHEAALLRVEELRQHAAAERRAREAGRGSRSRGQRRAAASQATALRAENRAAGDARAREGWSTAA
jgi:hypothetical protein